MHRLLTQLFVAVLQTLITGFVPFCVFHLVIYLVSSGKQHLVLTVTHLGWLVSARCPVKYCCVPLLSPNSLMAHNDFSIWLSTLAVTCTHGTDTAGRTRQQICCLSSMCLSHILPHPIKNVYRLSHLGDKTFCVIIANLCMWSLQTNI